MKIYWVTGQPGCGKTEIVHRNFNLGSRVREGVDSQGSHGLTPAATFTNHERII